jgi:hypothetical protein
MAQDRENFFIILALDPNRNYTAQEIDASIAKNQSKWSDPKNKNAALFKSYRDRIPEIRAIMGNPESKAEEAARAKEIISQTRAAIQRDIVDKIRTNTFDGYIDIASIERIAHNYKEYEENVFYKDLVSLDAVKKYVEGGIVTINENPATLPVEISDFSVLKNRRQNLAIAGCRDFYALLGLDNSAPLADLQKKARDDKKRNGSLPNKTAIVDAKAKLFPEIEKAFSTEECRQQYHLECEVTKLLPLLDLVSGLSEPVRYNTYQEIFQKGIGECGADPKLVEWFIHSGGRMPRKGEGGDGRKRIFSIELKKGGQEKKTTMLCGVCGNYNIYPASLALETALCTHCGEPLYFDCPKCRTKTAGKEKVCAKCGQNMSEVITARKLFLAAQESFSGKMLEKASRQLAESTRLVPGTEKTKEFEAKLSKEQVKIASLVKNFNDALTEKRLRDVIALFDELSKITLDHPLFEKKPAIEQDILAADAIVKKARAASDAREKEKLLLEASGINAQAVGERDIPPPSAPSGLKIAQGLDNVRLTWQASPSSGKIMYRVLRKENGHPNSPEDGKVLGNVETLNYTDSSLEPGSSYYYAVYASRAGSFSSDRQVAGPAILIAGVADLRAVPGNRTVSLKWRSPKSCTVMIVRKEKGAADAAEIKLREGFDGVEFTDSNVKNETFYTYTVQSVFANGQKGEKTSVTVCPTQPPTPIVDLRVGASNTDEAQKRTLSWSPAPSNCQMQIIHAQTQPKSYSAGESYSLDEIKTWGGNAPILQSGSTEVKLISGMNYFIPVTIKGDAAVCGKIAFAPFVEILSALKGDGTGETINLSWQWPENIKNAVVVYAYDSFPESPTANNIVASQEISRSEGKAVQKITLHVSQKCVHYFSIFGKLTANNQIYFSLPAKTQVFLGNLAEISYRVIKKGLFSKKFFVQFQSNEKGELNIPNLQLRVNSGEVPLNSNDGVLLSSINNLAIKGGEALVELPSGEFNSGRFLKVFFKEGQNNNQYRLMPEKRDLLQIK